MNELHLQNPAFNNLIYRLERSSETGQYRINVTIPVHKVAPRERIDREFWSLFSHNSLRDEIMVWETFLQKYKLCQFDDFDKMLKKVGSIGIKWESI
jgi:hypothetical protein